MYCLNNYSLGKYPYMKFKYRTQVLNDLFTLQFKF